MNKRVVVTGGAGFIGRNCVAMLNQRGVDDIIIVDTLADYIQNYYMKAESE